MPLELISSPDAPAAIGPYSQAIVHGGLVWCSGQIALPPQGGEMPEGVEAQTHQVLANLQAVLVASGSGLDRALKVCVYLADMNDFGAFNAIYADAMGDHRPARATVEVARLPKDARIEIDCVATVREVGRWGETVFEEGVEIGR